MRSPADLTGVIETLRHHRDELRARGVLHAAVIGSTARGEARDASDIDVLVQLDPENMPTLFAYAGIKLFLDEVFGRETDLVDEATLKPLVRRAAMRDAVDAF
jgi:uncharacterized protein